MKEPTRQTEKLDEIGTRLIKSASFKDEEIERIISKPHLFDSIKARIEDDKNRRKKKNVFADLFHLLHLPRVKISFAFAALGIFAMVSIGLFLFNQTVSEKVLIAESFDPVKTFDSNAPIEIPVLPQTSVEENPKPAILKAKKKMIKRQTAVKEQIGESLKPLRKKSLPPQNQPEKISEEELFYPLMFAGNLNFEDSRRIIRVELIQESLAELGINLPLEDENEKVRADLLVGSDGQPQAYRIVNNF